ncbi:MAG TPA: lysoplasmalogenase [Spirochaetota bacterium]|nr:lysoplasmalogenase [Spirochaetota bacterium]HPS87988.1 lysoplasmalogenase [Spirochaetota bacterium]
MNCVIISAALILLAGLLFFEKRESVKGLLATKPLLSFLFIVTALLQTHNNITYFYIIFTGLLLCFAGDICLIFFSNKKVFTSGLGAFLAGHIMYSIAFFKFGETGRLMFAVGAAGLVAGTAIFVLLKSRLGSMAGPVCAYIIIITVMTISAASFKNNGMHNPIGRNLVFAGALLFYISDVFVARHRFVQKQFLNRAIGLPMYYTAQFMIAYSTGLITV